MRTFFHNLFLHHQVSKQRHTISVIVLSFLCLVFGVLLYRQYWPTKEIVVTKIVQELPLTREMRIVSQYIKEKYPMTPQKVADQIAYQIITQSKMASIPYELTLGIMAVESGFNPYAVSSKQARGLMQVLVKECSAGEINQNEIFDVDYNITMGLCIFNDHLKYAQGDLSKALYGYVGGDSVYIEKVLRTMGEFMLYRESNR